MSLTIDILHDLYNRGDIDGDSKVVASVDDKLIPLASVEVKDNLIILHDKVDTTSEVVEECCGNCKLLLENGVCEYYNIEVNMNDRCDEFIF